MVIYYTSWIYSAGKHFVQFFYPLKTKSLIDTTPAIKTCFSTSGIHELNKDALVIIMSDSDTAFRGDNRDEDQSFQKY